MTSAERAERFVRETMPFELGYPIRQKLRECLTRDFEEALQADADQRRADALEIGRLRNLCLQLEAARDERDHFEELLTDIGRHIGCGHIDDNLPRCVEETLEKLTTERDALMRLLVVPSLSNGDGFWVKNDLPTKMTGRYPTKEEAEAAVLKVAGI